MGRGASSCRDRLSLSDGFWPAWRVLSAGLGKALARSGLDWSTRKDVARALFLNLNWKEETKEWEAIRGREESFLETFRTVSPSNEAIEAFLSFLIHVGRRLLPEALSALHEKLPPEPLGSVPINRLEASLSEFVYGGEPRIRREEKLRLAVLGLLDALVDAGSSFAYRMRDDFVTPFQEGAAKSDA